MSNSKLPPKRMFFAIFFWVLTAVCAAVIFYLSHQVADESAKLSEEVQGFLGALLNRLFEINIVRKAAHFLEYCGLCFLMSHAIYATKGEFKPTLTVALCAAYALTDEIHQYFIPGRACRIFDLGVDTLGAALTMTIIYLLYFLIRGRKKRNEAE